MSDRFGAFYYDSVTITMKNQNLEGSARRYCFCHSLFIVCPMFILAERGARMRGEEPQGEGSLRKLRSPLSLRFSPTPLRRCKAPSFLILSSLGARLLSCAELRGIGFRKAGARGRKPKGKGECELCELPPSTWVCHPRPVGRSGAYGFM